MISRRFAREWCVVVLRNTWNTTSLINGTNFHKLTEKLLRQNTAQYFMVHPAKTRKLHVTIEHLGTPTPYVKQPLSTEPPTGADRARVSWYVAPIPSCEKC